MKGIYFLVRCVIGLDIMLKLLMNRLKNGKRPKMDFTSLGFLGGGKSLTVLIFLGFLGSTSGLEKAHFL
jgi:hypothetical protein